MADTTIRLTREDKILRYLNKHVDGAPWHRDRDLEGPGELAFVASPCNPFDCPRRHPPEHRLIPVRHVERYHA